MIFNFGITKNIRKFAFTFALLILLSSCESNDSPVSNNTPAPPADTSSKVLIELFTNTSCVPCVEANQYLDAIYSHSGITSSDSSVVIIRIHTTLFAGDPYYLYNTADNDARMAFYPNSAVVNPRGYLLGTFMSNYSPDVWTNKINDKLSSARTFAITLSNSYDTVSRSGNLAIRIKQVSGDALSDLVYHVALTENDIQYTAPNGETHFNNTLRDLITPPAGQALVISPGQTNNYSQPYSIASEINQHKAELVVFVQRTGTKEVTAVERVYLR